MSEIILEISVAEDVYNIYEEYVNSLYVTGKRISSVGDVIAHLLDTTAITLAERQESEWPILIGEVIGSPSSHPPMDALVTEIEELTPVEI